jgi:hypothetical protein
MSEDSIDKYYQVLQTLKSDQDNDDREFVGDVGEMDNEGVVRGDVYQNMEMAPQPQPAPDGGQHQQEFQPRFQPQFQPQLQPQLQPQNDTDSAQRVDAATEEKEKLRELFVGPDKEANANVLRCLFDVFSINSESLSWFYCAIYLVPNFIYNNSKIIMQVSISGNHDGIWIQVRASIYYI